MRFNHSQPLIDRNWPAVGLELTRLKAACPFVVTSLRVIDPTSTV